MLFRDESILHAADLSGLRADKLDRESMSLMQSLHNKKVNPFEGRSQSLGINKMASKRTLASGLTRKKSIDGSSEAD